MFWITLQQFNDIFWIQKQFTYEVVKNYLLFQKQA